MRGFSQLDLAIAVAGSARHISFLETGRARPRRELVLRLCDALAVPKREQNVLLRAAGFAIHYAEHPLDATTALTFQTLVDGVLLKQLPFPAFAIDRRWTVLRANSTAVALFGVEQLGRCSLQAICEPGPIRDAMVNAPEVAASIRPRLVKDLVQYPGEPALPRLLEMLDTAYPNARSASTDGLAGVARYRVHGEVLETLTTVAQFSAAQHVALDELRVELLYPVNARTERAFEALAQQASAAGAPPIAAATPR